MIFVNTHPDLAGKHALLGASKHAWLNYTDEKLMDAYRNSFAAQIGTLLHEYAKDKIFYRQKMEDNQSEKNNVLLHSLKNDIPLDVINLDGLFYNLWVGGHGELFEEHFEDPRPEDGDRACNNGSINDLCRLLLFAIQKRGKCPKS